ncbi:hypothetical protein [Nocardia gamkensis]|uniref:hypothetical protein n=1 Tax=Nocardia gamkensis TaxID=352869 RepID=UPI0037C67086
MSRGQPTPLETREYAGQSTILASTTQPRQAYRSLDACETSSNDVLDFTTVQVAGHAPTLQEHYQAAAGTVRADQSQLPNAMRRLRDQYSHFEPCARQLTARICNDLSVPQHFRIFVASPSDVRDERQAIFEIAARVPYDPVLRGKVTLEIVAWDGPYGSIPLLATVDPQTAVSAGLPLPSECDVVVVVIHSRLGTPLPSKYAKDDGNRPVTGTEWEYEDAIRAHHTSGTPEVLVYRREGPASLDLDSTTDASALIQAHRQIQAVEESFSRLEAERRGFNNYNSVADFAASFADHLKTIVRARLDNPTPVRSRVLAALADGNDDVPTSELIGFAANILEEPHLRIMAVDRLSERVVSAEQADTAQLRELAQQLMTTRHDELGEAGIKLAKRLVTNDKAPIAFLRSGATNPKWRVKAATVAITRGSTTPQSSMCTRASARH